MKLKAMNILGLAQRAGKVVSGDFRVKDIIRKGKAKLLIVAEDSSERTLQELVSLCKYYNVPVIQWGSKQDLGAAIGKSIRVSVVVLEEQMSTKIKMLLERGEI